jgi:hypothetical protein
MSRHTKLIRAVVADGFTERQSKRDQQRLKQNELKAASARKRRSAIQSAGALERGKLPTPKAAGGTS